MHALNLIPQLCKNHKPPFRFLYDESSLLRNAIVKFYLKIGVDRQPSHLNMCETSSLNLSFFCLFFKWVVALQASKWFCQLQIVKPQNDFVGVRLSSLKMILSVRGCQSSKFFNKCEAFKAQIDFVTLKSSSL